MTKPTANGAYASQTSALRAARRESNRLWLATPNHEKTLRPQFILFQCEFGWGFAIEDSVNYRTAINSHAVDVIGESYIKLYLISGLQR